MSRAKAGVGPQKPEEARWEAAFANDGLLMRKHLGKTVATIAIPPACKAPT